jgi:hypothetical protein
MTTKTAPATTAHCHRCGRVLRAAKSIADGYGRTCARKVAEAAKAAALTDTQAVKVADALEAGAVSHRVRNLFQVVSSDGATVYDVDLAAGSCTCKAGQYGRVCYHLKSAAVLAAA